MLYRLVLEKDGKRTREVTVRTSVARIGRAQGNQVRIPSAEVSRRHCRISEHEGLLWVEDLESVNGTYVNGDLITGRVVARPGDRLRVGPVTFVVEYELTPDALERLLELDDEGAAASDAEVAVESEDAGPRTPTREAGRQRPRKEEIAEAEEVPEVEEVVEAEDYVPRADLDEVTWAAPHEGDLRDMLAHLDEGQESLLPRKRPGAQPREDEDNDWPADRRSGLEPPPKPKGKRRPKDQA